MAENRSMTVSWASSEHTRRSMLGNRSRDTLPELAVRRLVHAAGLRYRVDYPPLRDRRRLRADIVFTRAKVAVFIDGCFWHGCPEHHRRPRANAEYWTAKVNGNRRRDISTDETLAAAGWVVLRFWDHQDPGEVAEEIRTAVRPPSTTATTGS